MDFKDFYQSLYFDVNSKLYTNYKAKQGDTKSRGFYITLLVNNQRQPVTSESLFFYAEKPDGTRVFAQAEKEGDMFRLDLPNQIFAVAGKVKCELVLNGSDGEKISTQTFNMDVSKSLQENSIISEDERGIIDEALEMIGIINDLDIEALENLDTELKESVNESIQVKDDLDNSRQLAETTNDGLDSSISTGQSVKSDLDDLVSEANNVDSSLAGNITTGNNLKSGLDSSIDQAGDIKNDLDNIVVESDTIKTELAESVSTANSTKADLDSSIGEGEELKDDLSDIIAGSDFEEVINDISDLKNEKVDKEDGKGLSTEDYTTAEKDKLEGIEANANNYTHPETHPPSIIEQDENNRFMTDAERTKLSNIEAGANNYSLPSTLPASMITPSSSRSFVTDTEKSNWNGKASADDLNNHIDDTDNPHNVTKDQVGLGNVPNYSIANQNESFSGTSNTRYMTPLRTQEAIDSQTELIINNRKSLEQPRYRFRYNATNGQLELHVLDNNDVWKLVMNLGNRSAAGSLVYAGNKMASENYVDNALENIDISDLDLSEATDIIIGKNASSSLNRAVVIGMEAEVSGYNTESQYGSVAIGYRSHSSVRGVAIGREAEANSNFATAIGHMAEANSNQTTAIGSETVANSNFATAIGYMAESLNSSQGMLGGSPTNKWIVPGSFTVEGTKNFEMPHPHPDKQHTHRLRHSAVESPTAGDNMYRFTVEATEALQEVEVELPDYFMYLNKDIDVWVNGVDHFGRAYGKVDGNILKVTCELPGQYKALVIGTRNDDHQSVQDWDIKGVEREIGESWTGETYAFSVDEIMEVEEIKEGV